METASSCHQGPSEKPADQLRYHHYVFGFGSIINTTTHAPWLSKQADAPDDNNDNSAKAVTLPGQQAKILASFGYRRGWNFRSNTGFTALGITITKDEEQGMDINGVLFRITEEMLADFDRREVGYDRVEIKMEDIEFVGRGSSSDEAEGQGQAANEIPDGKMWVYIPQEASCVEANEDHPILQSYVDTVMQGCLEWGGEAMAMEFVATTSNWSPYFLNDTPSSRRPWLFRKEYNTIDRILSQNPVTHYADRRHPEEFASAFLIKMMRGAWSLPRRNTVFTGRDAEIGQIHARLTAQRTDHSPLSGVAKLEVAGMGGVGKTQICTEYCYRYFPSYYGLVIWLRAPSAESIAAGYRQLMADTTGVDVKDKDTDEVVAEVKARLFRSKVPWLLVFDNLEDQSLLEKFVPNGGIGHVLVTTRLVNTDNIDSGDQTMILGCFNPSESVELLCRAAGKQNISCSAHLKAANELADHLGHLPLALGMAAAYMRMCDVDATEYLARYVKSEMGVANLGHEAVASSLSLSLEAIKTENPIAWEALRLLSWLGPDQITKKLVRSLLAAKNANARASEDKRSIALVDTATTVSTSSSNPVPYLPFVAGGIALCSMMMIGRISLSRPRKDAGRIELSTLALLSVAASAALAIQFQRQVPSVSTKTTAPAPASSMQRNASFSADVFEQTDQTWKLLKSFSLLVVKEGKGSMHRLLAQSLRLSQNEQEGRCNIEICLQALLQAWTFKAEQVETWAESTTLLEHVKAVVVHTEVASVEMATLSREAGVFSAMSLNRFEEAQFSLEQSLRILDAVGKTEAVHFQARAAALHELGRVLRYEGNFKNSEEALCKALEIRNRLARENLGARHEVAATLHELGVLEVKKHNLDSAATFLQRALDLRRSLDVESPLDGTEAECASTLHQLAAVQVAMKPPSLDRAEALLREALGLNMQIGQRAATLKQLARVAMRRGEFKIADRSLAMALELYDELYGENTLHINTAAVRFQQGALALQREQLEQAWVHFSECLRARRHVYAYSQGNHLEVSTVLHELACVAFAQNRIPKASECFTAEREILELLYETSSHRQRMLQARLTNLTWLRKCAKEQGDEEQVRRIVAERSELKRIEKQQTSEKHIGSCVHPSHILSLEQEALHCRLAARQFVLSKPESEKLNREHLNTALINLLKEIDRSPASSLREATTHFHEMISECLADDLGSNGRSPIFEACDDFRDILRDHDLQVNDKAQSKQ